MMEIQKCKIKWSQEAQKWSIRQHRYDEKVVIKDTKDYQVELFLSLDTLDRFAHCKMWNKSQNAKFIFMLMNMNYVFFSQHPLKL